MKKTQATTALMATILAASAIDSMAADRDEGERDRWRLITSPMLWYTGIEGDITRRGLTADVDVSPEDMFDATEYGFSSHLELRRDKFGFYAAPSFAKLEADGERRNVTVDFEMDFWLVNGGFFYNFYQTKDDPCPFTIDGTLGLRYLNTDTELEFRGLGAGGGSLELDGSTELFDPTVGLRLKKYITERFSITLRGDVGGFGISEGDTSDFSWEGMGLLGYDINKRFTIIGGYRGIGVDTSEDSGAEEKGFDLTWHGAVLGLQVTW